MISARTMSLFFLIGLLLSCTTPPQTTQSQPSKKQTSHGLSASVSYQDRCTELHQSGAPISMSFALCTDVCSGFDFFPQANAPKDDFAWLCGRYDHLSATVRLEALISPESYKALLAKFDLNDFFNLPKRIQPLSPRVHASSYILEATRDGVKHRIDIYDPEILQASPELLHAKEIWEGFNAFLPEPLRIPFHHK